MGLTTGARALTAARPSDCVCGLDPCLAPTCAAMSWDSWSGTFTADDRSLAPYQGTPDSVVRAMLDLARLRSGETFVDIGAGDGRVLLEAVLKYDAGRAVGVELDPAVHAIGLAHIKGRFAAAAAAALPTAARQSRVELLQADILDVPLSTYAAHVVALYLLPAGHAALEPYLAKHLPPGCGARVIAHGWPVPGWQPAASQVSPQGTRLYLYER